MNTQLLLCFTSLMGFAPAIIIMYYLLRTYEEYFRDKNIFGFFAGGMVIGMVVFAVHALVDPQVVYSLDLAILIYVLAFAAFEELAKYIVLYFKRFLGKYETTYLGLSMGLGFGATSIIGIAYQDFLLNPGVLAEDPIIIPTVIILAIGFVGLHATTGSLIGFGSAKEVRWRPLGHAILFHAAFNLVLLFFWWSGLWVRLLLALVLAAISVGGVMLINNRIMPLSLPRKLARERRKDMRRRRIRGRSRTVAGGASGGEGGKSAEDGEE